MTKSLLSKMPCLLVILLCLLLSIAAKTSAEEISGMWGTCPWRIDNGTLTISAGTGSDTGGVCPWKEYYHSIWDVMTESGVILPADAFSSDYVIFLNGVCTEYTWQWVKRHPELFIEFCGNGQFPRYRV